MKSLGTLLFIAALAFYVAWPVYSGYEIKTSLDAKDAARLSAKIDFPSVRASLRPAVAAKVEKTLTAALKKAGPSSGPLTDSLRAKLMPGIIDSVLAVLVTPETLIRIHSDGTNLKDVIDGIVAERAMLSGSLGDLIVAAPGAGGSEGGLGSLGKIAEKLGIDPGKALGGLGSKKEVEAAPVSEPAAQGPGQMGTGQMALGYGPANIKRFGLDGPLSVAVGVAKDPMAREADLTAEMSFIDGDWKLTALVPKI
jgi:hypothetical protein